MIQRLKPNSDFSRNVLTLMTGTTLAQAIPIASAPILTRLYTPDDFGILALFVGVTAIFGGVANGRYERAIMLPEKDEDAINIAALGLLIALSLSVALLVSAFVLNAEITNLLGNPEIGRWLYFVPFVVLMMGLYNGLNYLNTRKERYKDIAKASIYKATAMTSVQLGIGYIKSGATGLITGQIISNAVANYSLGKNALENYDVRKINKLDIKRLAKRYIDFPKFSMWSSFANTASQHFPVFLLSSFSSLSNVGYFSLANRLMLLPVSVVGSNFGQVFFQKISKFKTKKEQESLTLEVLYKLTLLAIVPFSIIFAYGDHLASFILGEAWRQTGIYMQIFSPWLFLVFVVSPLTNLYAALERQKVALFFNLVLLVARVGSLSLGYIYFQLNDTEVVVLFAGVSSFLWLFWLVHTLSMVSEKWLKESLKVSVAFVAVALSLLFFRGWLIGY